MHSPLYESVGLIYKLNTNLIIFARRSLAHAAAFSPLEVTTLLYW